MITGELKNKIDALWDMFAASGLVNPLEVIEQITYLMFIRDLDDTDNVRAKESVMLGIPYQSIGDYKERPNMIGMYKTALPKDVAEKMRELLQWYSKQEKNLTTLAEFHVRYEIIHPFQDGNGRTGRMILFREALKSADVDPFIIQDDNRSSYIEGLKEYREEQKTDKLVSLMQQETVDYYQQCSYFME